MEYERVESDGCRGMGMERGDTVNVQYKLRWLRIKVEE